MQKTKLICVTVIFLSLLQVSCRQQSRVTEVNEAAIAYFSRASASEVFAAKEIRKYIYLRTNFLLPLQQISQELPAAGDLIITTTKNNLPAQGLLDDSSAVKNEISSLQNQEYQLATIHKDSRKILLIVGADEIAALYGAYRFAELLGVRFYLHGDVIPDEKITFEIPDVNETAKPLFALRGIQPFHDFPEGPDWWNEDDYKAILAQLPKLRMNFFGMHTYPEGWSGPEPLVWIGLEEDIEPDGNVKTAYPSRHITTMTDVVWPWRYAAIKTSSYYFGAADIFESDDYGADYMVGVNPWNQAPDEKQTKLFNDMGKLLDSTFSFAQRLGIKTCIGTETPLIIPRVVRRRLINNGLDPNDPRVVEKLYEGMFARIKRTHPLDYYWLWTPENWLWAGDTPQQVDKTIADIQAAINAAKKTDAPFTIGTCGWVLGPQSNRSLFDNLFPKKMPMACINTNVGIAEVEDDFADIHNRPKWSIPWLEDDPALIVPQLWVGRMRKDAADSLAYGCTGLMGIHWRTRILSPNVSALAYAAWEQAIWNPNFNKPLQPKPITERRLGGQSSHFTDEIADTNDDVIYQNVIYNMEGYNLKIPDGTCKVTLQFCEPYYNETGKRVFGAKLQGQTVIDSLDVFEKVGKNKALDYAFDDIKVSDGVLKIGFIRIVEFPCIAGIVIEGKAADSNEKYVRKINCGGEDYKDYQQDLPSEDEPAGPRDLPCLDFYQDWAFANFGPEAAVPLAELFTSLDGGQVIFSHSGQDNTNLPRPSTWIDGPGGVRKDARSWQQAEKDYEFIKRMEGLREKVKGAGNLERFDYWLNNFRYLREVGHFACVLTEYDRAIEKVRKVGDPEEKKKLSEEAALVIFKQLVEQLENIHRYLLAMVNTTGEMGTVCNWQSHLIPMYITEPAKELSGILGRQLPEDALPSKLYSGQPRLFVPTVRTSLLNGESLKLKVIAVSLEPIEAFFYWRPMAGKEFERIQLTRVNRAIYTVTIPAEQIEDDFEYYIEFKTDEKSHFYPATAPKINQTVVLMPEN